MTIEAIRNPRDDKPDGEAREHRRILVIEDDAATAAVLKSGLEASGYAVERAADGPASCQAAREEGMAWSGAKYAGSGEVGMFVGSSRLRLASDRPVRPQWPASGPRPGA